MQRAAVMIARGVLRGVARGVADMVAVRLAVGAALVVASAGGGGCGDCAGARPPGDPGTGQSPGAGPPSTPPSATATGFVPPHLIDRQRAVGPPTVTPLDRLLYRDEGCRAGACVFEPIPAPDEGDWLAEHVERGQPYPAFLASRPNMPGPACRDPARRGSARCVIYLLPIGDLGLGRVGDGDGDALGALSEFVRVFFQLPVAVLPAIEVDRLGATSRVNESSGRVQLLSTDILTYLAKNLPDDAYSLIALTRVDLYPEASWNFVFGQASLRERVGVYSTARLDPAFSGDRDPDTGEAAGGARVWALFLGRVLRLMAHELGHMFGIEHCVFYRCVMNGSNHLAESDSQPLHLCPIDLRKLARSVGFDPPARYRDLLALYRRLAAGAPGSSALADEIAWLEGRLAQIAGD